MSTIGPSEFDNGSDLRTDLQKAYGAGEEDNPIWNADHPGEED